MEPSPTSLPPETPEQVVVHASLRGTAAGIATPVALLGLGGSALADGGYHPVPIVLVVFGAVIGAIVALDLPRRTEFDEGGLTRVCWARRHRLPWGDLVAIERTAAGRAARMRNSLDRRDSAQHVVSGGLVARGRGKRRWLLTDRVESRAEHDRLSALLRGTDTAVALRAPRPNERTPPTDLYRRRRR